MKDYEKAALLLTELKSDPFNVEIVMDKLMESDTWKHMLWRVAALPYNAARLQEFGDVTASMSHDILKQQAIELADDSRFELLESDTG